MRRRTAKRKNPLPAHGALFVSNPRPRRAVRKNTRRRTRRNLGAVTLLPNGRRRKSTRRRARASSSVSSLLKKLGLRKNGRRRVRKNTRRRHMRRNTVILTNGRRRRSSRRSFKMNRRRGGRRMRRNTVFLTNGRRHRRRRVRRNGRRMTAARGYVGGILGTASKLLGKIPLVGGFLATYAIPALFGAAVIEPIRMVLKYGGKYLPAMLQPYGFTIGGMVVAALVSFLPINPQLKKSLAIAAATAGGAVDFYRYRTGQKGLGDGGLYSIEATGLGGYGGADGIEGQVVLGDVSDASFADADFAAADFSMSEGNAALSGPRAWRMAYRPPHVTARRHGEHQPSRHAGKEHGQWGWLIKLVGFKGMQKIAALPPEQRVEVIGQLKGQAKQALPGLLAGDGGGEEQALSGMYGGHLYAGAGY